MHSSDQPESAAEMFGLLLRHFRERAGLSQDQLGKRIGYSKSQVAMVERARARRRACSYSGRTRCWVHRVH